MPAATLSSKGQLVIPKEVRDRMGVRPGDRVDFVMQDNGDVLIRPAVASIDQLYGLLHRPGQRAVSVEEMNEAVAQRAAADDRRIRRQWRARRGKR
jgi:AbrB family looped-hinge helix DNA binding protein